jgi:hypothetical protein
MRATYVHSHKKKEGTTYTRKKLFKKKAISKKRKTQGGKKTLAKEL